MRCRFVEVPDQRRGGAASIGVGGVGRIEAHGVEQVAVAVQVDARRAGVAAHAHVGRNWPGVSTIAVVPPPFASVYWYDGSKVRLSFSPRCHSDWMRMLPVFDGLMRTP